MASSENLATFEPWTFRPPFVDTWFSDAIAHDTEVLTKALHKSFSGANTKTINTHDTISPVVDIIRTDSAAPTPTGSGLSGSDDHESVPKRRRNGTAPVLSGKVLKRKSRASKKSQTTFITADPANFREMVQRVTGARVGNSPLLVAPTLKPQPQRPASGLTTVVTGMGCLPTLDTSALLLNQPHQRQIIAGPAPDAGPGVATIGSGSLPLGWVIGSGGGHDPVSYRGLGFDALPSFPTLESWKVM